MKVAFTLLLAMFFVGATVAVRDSSRAMAQARKSTRRYACPMHPDVTSTRLGKCRKCGMALRVVKSSPPITAASNNQAKSATPPTASIPSIPDTPVLDQNGKPLKFYTDLIKGKTVAINFIFTTCTTICPSLTATFRRVQKDLGEHAGRDVHLISISVDPSIDVPERLRAFADKFNAGPGWTFVTGDKSEVDGLLKALGTATADKNDHTPMVLIGNDRAGYWTRIYGLSPPATFARTLAEMSNRK
jgi:protein SCO1